MQLWLPAIACHAGGCCEVIVLPHLFDRTQFAIRPGGCAGAPGGLDWPQALLHCQSPATITSAAIWATMRAGQPPASRRNARRCTVLALGAHAPGGPRPWRHDDLQRARFKRRLHHAVCRLARQAMPAPAAADEVLRKGGASARGFWVVALDGEGDAVERSSGTSRRALEQPRIEV